MGTSDFTQSGRGTGTEALEPVNGISSEGQSCGTQPLTCGV